MTCPPQPVSFTVESFCLHCGLIQEGRFYGAEYSWSRSREQIVIVHCEGCGGVSRHCGASAIDLRVAGIGGQGRGDP